MSQSTSMLQDIAGRYAAALFDLAKTESRLDAVEGDLSRLDRMIASARDMQALIRSPVLSREEQGRAAAAIASRAQLDNLTTRFLGLLASKRRLMALPQIIRIFRKLAANFRGEMTAEVVSAHPLTEAQIIQMKGTLKDSYKRDVRLEARIDPTLIGGFVLKVGSRQIDFSIRARLNALGAAMKGAA